MTIQWMRANFAGVKSGATGTVPDARIKPELLSSLRDTPS